MKSRILTCITAMTLFATLAIPVSLAAQSQQQQRADKPQRYTVTDLGTLGGTFSAALGNSNKGLVTGWSTPPGDQVAHAFLWRKGVITDLGTFGGPDSMPAFAPVNERGEVGGGAETSTPDPNGEDFCSFGTHLICLPFVWKDGVLTTLPLLGGNNGFANEINNRGQVAGVAENTAPGPTCFAPLVLEQKPVLWDNGAIQELPTVSGDPDGVALAINDKGQAAGLSFNCADSHAVLWQNGTATDLGNLGGMNNNVAGAINNRGQVVGNSDLPGDTTQHAVLWQNGVITDLGTLPGDVLSLAVGINSKTQVVGASVDASGNERAFLWENGVMTDLNTLIPVGSPLFLVEADGINSRGEIVGAGLPPSGGQWHAFLATPCDEKNGNDEGCGDDTSGVTAATGVSPAPSAQGSTITNQGSPMFRGVTNPMLRRFAPSSGPWYRGLGGRTPTSTLISPAPSSTEGAGHPSETATECINTGDVIEPFGWYRGNCWVENGILNGYCLARIPNTEFCTAKASASCPRGARAITPHQVLCGQGFDTIDLARACGFWK